MYGTGCKVIVVAADILGICLGVVLGSISYSELGQLSLSDEMLN